MNHQIICKSWCLELRTIQTCLRVCPRQGSSSIMTAKMRCWNWWLIKCCVSCQNLWDPPNMVTILSWWTAQLTSLKKTNSICIRYVSDKLIPEEIFLGLYDASSSQAQIITNIIKDFLLLANLPLTNVRGTNDAVKHVRLYLMSKRTTDHFQHMWSKALSK